MSENAVLAVFRLSDSFSDFWPLLAREAGATVAAWEPGDPQPSGAAMIVIAAGGREGDVPAELGRLERTAGLPVVVVGADPSRRLALRVAAAGASDYLVLPEDRDVLRDALGAAVARHRAARGRTRLASLEARAHAFSEIVGKSAALRSVLERAARLLPHADATVLIGGETGTGKELLARALHYGGPRATAPFVELNCAALPAQLLESELFGHEKGAFTDARTAKPGLFEVADGGTLFLDEIHQLAPELQSKLLRAIEHKTIRRVGGTATRRVDVRIVAASNVDLAGAVAAGRFREDVFYRLNVLALELPPLRERGDDIVLLAEIFLDRFAVQYRLPRPPLTGEVRQLLLCRPWPGNVRELRNAIERAVLLSPPGTLAPDEFAAAVPANPAGPLPFPSTMAEIQRAAAHAMVAATGGNRSEAARRLGISRSRLQRLLEGRTGEDEDGSV